ncbi:MAG: hypothetical protein RLZZ447_2053, partial [Verrucomicrobiota bacterium]
PAYPASSTVAAATPALHAAVLTALRGEPPVVGGA